MAFAILKLSYNEPGDSSLTGGICGTGFFLDSSTAITAHHVLQEETLAPNIGYRHVRLWLISRSGAVCRIERSAVSLHPEIDTSVIRLRNPVSGFTIYDVIPTAIEAGLRVRGIGHKGNGMPSVDAEWQGTELLIRQADLSQLILDRDGHVKRPLTLNINARDVKMLNVRGLELSFGSQIGMSGGPLVSAETGRVLGMLSIGLPPDANVKTQTFAVSIGEVVERIRGSGA
jgi:Trypsin-like peptidase domain